MKKIFYLTIIILFLFTAGCLNVKYPDRKQFAFDIPKTKKISIHPSKKVLEIGNTSIATQFSSNNFIYRTNSVNYLTDYYNTFFSPPDQQINQIITNYLRDTQLFLYVTNDSDYDDPHANCL